MVGRLGLTRIGPLLALLAATGMPALAVAQAEGPGPVPDPDRSPPSRQAQAPVYAPYPMPGWQPRQGQNYAQPQRPGWPAPPGRGYPPRGWQQPPQAAPPPNPEPRIQRPQGGTPPATRPQAGVPPGSRPGAAPAQGAPANAGPPQAAPDYRRGPASSQPGGPWSPYSNPRRLQPGPGPIEPARPEPELPSLQLSLASGLIYVHQNLVATLEIFGDSSLSTYEVKLPDSDAVIMRQLGEPEVRAATSDGRREALVRLHYQLTPLRSGRIELDPLRVVGKLTGKGGPGRAYEVATTTGIRLQVRPPRPGVRPWLPLHELALNIRLENDEVIGEGRPLTLIMEQKAVGLTGAQLPSLESQLTSPQHRLYLESTDTDGRVSADGRLLGTRTDRYTLVPQSGNRVLIPSVKADWWNVERNRRETAIVPARELNAYGSAGDSRDDANARDRLFLKVWLVPMLVASFVLGFYVRAMRGLLIAFMPVSWRWLERATRPARQQLARWLLKLSPRRHLHVARRWFADSLPRSWRLWFCVRSADGENDPDDWNHVLRFLLGRRLGIHAQQSHHRLTRHLVEIHPHADPQRLRALMGELERALYGQHRIEDFDRWKRDFKREVRPSLLRWVRRARPRFGFGSSLPRLNPEI